MPAAQRPQAPSAAAGLPAAPQIDESVLGLVTAWRAVVAEMARVYHVDMHDPAVLDRPWLGIRTMIFALRDTPGSALREALTLRG